MKSKDNAFSAQAFTAALEDTPETRACIRRKTEQGIPVIEEALKNGTFDFTIYENPYGQGYRPVRLLFDILLNRRKPPRELYFPIKEHHG